MDTRKILAELKSERDRINAAIAALEALEGRASAGTARVAAKSATPKPAVKKRKLTPAGRRRLSENMKRRWAERKKAAAKANKAV